VTLTLVSNDERSWICTSIWFFWGLVLADRYGATLPGALLVCDPYRIDPWGISGRCWRFADEEAIAIADALCRALDDLPARACRLPSNLLELLGGDTARCFLEAMAYFCSRGGFEVT